MDHPALLVGAQVSESPPKRKILDWLTHPNRVALSDFQRFVVDLDWKNSPLGPISTWPPQLHQMVLLVMSDTMPAVVYWGDENTIVYNEPYTQLIGEKHPSLQGQDPKIGFVEVWDHFENLLSTQRETGEPTVEEKGFLLFHRHSFLEETYFSWKFVPIIGPRGWVVGSYATVVEVTREVLSDRRLSIVRDFSHELSGANTKQALWSRIIRGLEAADKDIPLALLYSVIPTSSGSSEGTSTSLASGASDSLVCCLEASFGIPQGHTLCSAKLNSETDIAQLLPYFVKAMEVKSPVVVRLNTEIAGALKDITWRGFGVPSNTFVVCPILPMNSQTVPAFLVMALNPRRPYDEDYKGFIHLLTQQVTTPQLSAVILHEEVERRQQLEQQETLHRERLHRELTESELKFTRFAQRAPVGIGFLRADGTALSANELWLDLTQLHIGSRKADWERVLVAEELDLILSAWEKVVEQKDVITLQTRIRRPWTAPELDHDGKEQVTDTHILLSMFPDFDENGDCMTVMSCITDITSLKWTEFQLRARMDQAIEMKKQQERFIDMTSHEMRNPLSALLGCADEIIASLMDYKSSISNSGLDSPSVTVKNLNPIDEAIEAADTIVYCAIHQKRIIDDILTLSRLDSNLLLISPAPSQPIELVRSALKMFEAELRRADTRLDFIEEESIRKLEIDWTLLDPSRVLQILINLLTNAIKFTRNEAKRHITTTVGASLTKPSKDNESGVEYVQKSAGSQDQTNKDEWGNGEVIYLSIAVADTGRGLSEKEKKSLFHVFKQASPKTYTQYGGSGLGLFISRQFVEMQGGEIGVASQEARGSIFQFYIKTRRTTPTVDTLEKPDFQTLVREDALREACTTEIPALGNGVLTPNTKPDNIPPMPHAISTPSKFHILVVEDNLVNQKVVSKQLRRVGHTISVANHGGEALDFIKRSEYWHTFATSNTKRGERLSVILMDMEMPVMDGVTCVRNIRQLQDLGKIIGHVPVIAVTANARKDQILQGLEAGMDDVITKPYRLQDMLKQIEKLVAK